MPAFELIVSQGIAGDPVDVSDSDDIAVRVLFQNSSAASGTASIQAVICSHFIHLNINTNCHGDHLKEA
jgi:hypothetical protein